MLLSSRSRSKTGLAGPGNDTAFLRPLSIQPFGQPAAGERRPRLSPPRTGSGGAARGQPGAQGPEEDLGLGPGLSIQVLFYQLPRPRCVPTATKRR